MAERTPIDNLLAAAAVAAFKLPTLDDKMLERSAKAAIRTDLADLAQAVHRSSPELAETLLADACLAVADAYPEHAEAIAVMDAARRLLVAIRRDPPETPDVPKRWEEKAGLMG